VPEQVVIGGPDIRRSTEAEDVFGHDTLFVSLFALFQRENRAAAVSAVLHEHKSIRSKIN
jgi:hypothetical protein